MNRSRLAALSPLLYLAVGLALLASGETWEVTPPLLPAAAGPTGWHAASLVAVCAAIVLQRRHPVAGFALAAVATLADASLGLHLGVFLAWTDTAYTLARRAERRQRQRAIGATGLALIVLSAVLVNLPDGELYALPVALTLTAGVAIPFWWGAEVRNGDERAARASAATQWERERSETARREAERERNEAVRHERTAMARELHDTVSAHLSGIALHSAAALSGAPDAELDRRALQHTRSASLAALDEMRTMIGLLHQPGEPVDLQVRDGLDALPGLIQRTEAAGVEVSAELLPVEVGPAVSHALLRFAQEGLANAAKHGTGTVRLRLSGHPTVVRLDIENPTPAPPVQPSASGGASAGIGLSSMRERLRAVGGTVQVTRADGRWRIRAEVPVESSEPAA
ncbi:hypothetical protein F7P69_06445 [Cellulosimicrobium funkei]|nr:hypothetical protein [Cellulosimicrobium funkei]